MELFGVQVGLGRKAKNDEITLVFVGFWHLGAFQERPQEASEDARLWESLPKRSGRPLGGLWGAVLEAILGPKRGKKASEKASKKVRS